MNPYDGTQPVTEPTPPQRGTLSSLLTPNGAGGATLNRTQLDIVGDVHGCLDELLLLLYRLGWSTNAQGTWTPPEGRILVFVGDLVNRGPASWGVLDVVSSLVAEGSCVFVMGNHDIILQNALSGSLTWSTSSLDATLDTLKRMKPDRAKVAKERTLDMFTRAPLWIDVESSNPKHALRIVHACWHPSVVDFDSELQESTCVYGPTVRMRNQKRPYRMDWRPFYPADDPLCIHGHVAFKGPVQEAHNTICLDTGCVFGGHLTALRWPQNELVQVKAQRAWSRYPNIPKKPALHTQEDLNLPRVQWPWSPQS